VPDRNQHRRATIRRSRSRSQVVVAHRRWSLRERDVRLPVRGLSQMVPTARSKRPETDEKGDRSEFRSMGANEKDRRSDKQRSSRSRRGATVLQARGPPRDVRMSRVLSIPEARINSSNAFVQEPYRKRLKRCVGCMSEFLHNPPRLSYPSESGTPTSTPVADVCPGARCSITTEHRASFVVIRTMTLLKLSISNSSDFSICMSIFTVCVCVRACVCVFSPFALNLIDPSRQKVDTEPGEQDEICHSLQESTAVHDARIKGHQNSQGPLFRTVPVVETLD